MIRENNNNNVVHTHNELLPMKILLILSLLSTQCFTSTYSFQFPSHHNSRRIHDVVVVSSSSKKSNELALELNDDNQEDYYSIRHDTNTNNNNNNKRIAEIEDILETKYKDPSLYSNKFVIDALQKEERIHQYYQLFGNRNYNYKIENVRVEEEESHLIWWNGTSPAAVLTKNKNQDHKVVVSLNDMLKFVLCHDDDDKKSSNKIIEETIEKISTLVNQRAQARKELNYIKADQLRDEITQQLTTTTTTTTTNNTSTSINWKIELKDIPYNQGGHSFWRIVPTTTSFTQKQKQKQNETILQMAHTCLGICQSCASSSSSTKEQSEMYYLTQIVEKVKDSLSSSSSSHNAILQELSGRKAADAIFWFALSGVSFDSSTSSTTIIYDELIDIQSYELLRFGFHSSSCRITDILHIVERVAASGYTYFNSLNQNNQKKNEKIQTLWDIAAYCIEYKLLLESNYSLKELEKYQDIIQSLRDGSFGFHSDRSLLWVWRFSTRQRKQNNFLKDAQKHYLIMKQKRHNDITLKEEETKNVNDSNDNDIIDWCQLFQDPTKPLVIDIGCGFGVSLLGLSQYASSSSQHEHDDQYKWLKDCNFVGCDLSVMAIRFAQNLASSTDSRDKKIAFLNMSAQQLMSIVGASYPGPIQLCMIQFPTPYKLIDKKKKKGNTQLPSLPTKGFMVTNELLQLIHDTLLLSKGGDGKGKLLVQSNCEDVAVRIQQESLKIGFQKSQECMKTKECDDSRMTKRTRDWLEILNNDIVRAHGVGWSSIPLLPELGRTETEVSCTLNQTPIHRCLLITQSK